MVVCQKFGQYIRMLYPGRFILVESVYRCYIQISKLCAYLYLFLLPERRWALASFFACGMIKIKAEIHRYNLNSGAAPSQKDCFAKLLRDFGMIYVWTFGFSDLSKVYFSGGGNDFLINPRNSLILDKNRVYEKVRRDNWFLFLK